MIKPSAIALIVSLLTLSTHASAQVRGYAQVDFTLPTTSVAQRALSSLRGQVVVVVYEDKDSAPLSREFKQALRAALDADPTFAAKVKVVGVANLGDFADWPMHDIALDAVKERARRQNVEIWMDWSRALVRSPGMVDRTSNVLLLDKRGRARVHRWGAITAAQAQELIRNMRTLANER